MIDLKNSFLNFAQLPVDVQQVLATRFALRSIPFLIDHSSFIREKNTDEETIPRSILIVLRMAISVFAISEDNQPLEIDLEIKPEKDFYSFNIKLKEKDYSPIFFSISDKTKTSFVYPDFDLGAAGNGSVPIAPDFKESISLNEVWSILADEIQVTFDELSENRKKNAISNTFSIWNLPLWHFANQSIQDVDFGRVFSSLDTNDDAWFEFWSKWLSDIRLGITVPKRLIQCVALIDDEIWESGPKAVASEIEGLQKPFEIREQIKELKSQLAQIEQPIAGIGHNNPPEAIETATPAQITSIIWADLEKLEKLTEDEHPDQVQLGEIGDRLRSVASRVGNFIKDVTYDSLKTNASDILKMSGAAWIATNGPAVKDLLLLISSQIDEWLAYLILAL